MTINSPNSKPLTITEKFASLVYIGKNTTVQDLLDYLNSLKERKAPTGQQIIAWYLTRGIA